MFAIRPALRLRRQKAAAPLSAKAKTKLENLCYTPAYAYYPLVGHWHLPLLPPRVVVQEAGHRIGEPNRTRRRDRTPRQARAAGFGLHPYADSWVDFVDDRVGHARGILHSKNRVTKLDMSHARCC